MKLLVAILAAAFGVVAIVFGGYDDSPGLQGLGASDRCRRGGARHKKRSAQHVAVQSSGANGAEAAGYASWLRASASDKAHRVRSDTAWFR
jgi:hypothetical protein